MGKRIEYIDAAKALGIIAVIVGHCFWRTSIPYLVPFIYSFHMPMFFMISGMFINENSLSISFKRNARNYLIPYLFGCAIQLMAVLVVSYRTNGFFNFLPLIKVWVLAVFFAKGSTDCSLLGSLPAIGPLWFLAALFWGATFYSYIKKIRSSLSRILLIVLLFTLSYMSLRIIRLPFCVQVGLSSIVFLWLGDIIKKYNLVEIMIKEKICIFAALSLWCLVVLGGSLYMNAGSYSMGLTSVIGSFCAVLLILSFLRKSTMGGGKNWKLNIAYPNNS